MILVQRNLRILQLKPNWAYCTLLLSYLSEWNTCLLARYVSTALNCCQNKIDLFQNVMVELFLPASQIHVSCWRSVISTCNFFVGSNTCIHIVTHYDIIGWSTGTNPKLCRITKDFSIFWFQADYQQSDCTVSEGNSVPFRHLLSPTDRYWISLIRCHNVLIFCFCPQLSRKLKIIVKLKFYVTLCEVLINI